MPTDDPLTPDEVAALLVLCEAATEGPWRPDFRSGDLPGSEWPAWVLARDPDGLGPDEDRIVAECMPADCALIAASRDALPRALRTLARVRELLECGDVEGARAVVGVAP